MKSIVTGHGMRGHKCLDPLEGGAQADAQLTVLCEEPRPAYDCVHLSEFFTGKTAEDLSQVTLAFLDRKNALLNRNARVTSIVFDLQSGESLETPESSLNCFPVRIDNNTAWIVA